MRGQLDGTVGQEAASAEGEPDAIAERVLASLNEHFVVLDRNWRYVYVNDRAAEVLQKPKEVLLGRCIWDLFPDAVGNLYYQELHRAVEERQDTVFDHYDAPSGRWFENRVHVTPDGLSVLATDVTERKRFEQALREREAHFRMLAEVMPQLVWTSAPDGMLDFCNSRWLAYTGLSAEEVNADGWAVVLHPDDVAAALEAWRRASVAGEEYQMEQRLRSADGSYRWFLVRALPLRDEQGNVVKWYGTCTDIDDRKQVEEALRASEREYRATFELAGSGKAQADPITWRFLRVNRRFCEITGYSEAELLERTFQDITHPDDLQGELEDAALVLRGERDQWKREKRFVRKDGSIVWVIVTGSLVHDAEGRPFRAIATVHDITDRKRVEEEREVLFQALQEERAQLRALNDTLEQRVAERTHDLTRANRTLEQRNRELQEFAYVALHDLQEPLRKIRAFSSMLQHEYGSRLDAEVQVILERMENAAARMSQLITDLLTFSRVATRTREFKRVDLRAVADEVLTDLEVSVAETGGRVVIEDLCHVEADPLQMRQLLQNLIGNALKFRRDDEPPVVHVRASLHRQRSGPIAFCRIEVEDNGVGFEEKYLERIFAPFQRLHEHKYSGTGMGLAICRRIAERHGGNITATSEPGKGSCFMVTLPVHQ